MTEQTGIVKCNLPNCKPCMAKSHTTGKPCPNPAMRNGRCRKHGGLSTGAPWTQEGKYSKFMPKDLRERFHAALEDPELLTLREEIAVHTARIGELLGRVGGAESSGAWRKAWQLYQEMGQCRDNPAMAGALLTELGRVLQNGVGQAAVWDEISVQTNHLKNLQRVEHQRLEAIQGYMTVQQAELLFNRMTALVKEHVQDPAARTAIAKGLVELATAQSSDGVGPTYRALDGE